MARARYDTLEEQIDFLKDKVNMLDDKIKMMNEMISLLRQNIDRSPVYREIVEQASSPVTIGLTQESQVVVPLNTGVSQKEAHNNETLEKEVHIQSHHPRTRAIN